MTLSCSVGKLAIVLGWLGLCCGGFAQNVTISLGSGRGGPAGTASVPITLASTGAQPAGLQWSFVLPSSITGVTIVPGPSATNAGKSVFCSGNNCIVVGFNNTTMTDGVVATATFQIAPNAEDSPTEVEFAGVIASDLNGASIPAAGAAGLITVAPPQLNAVTCGSSTIGTPGLTSCMVALTQTAPAGGLAISLSSNNPNLTVPQVTVSPGQATASFSVNAAQVTTNQAALITASAGNTSLFSTLSLLPNLGCVLTCTTDNNSLSGTYYFRQVLLIASGADVVETRSASGTLVFSGSGILTFSGQQLVNQAPAVPFSGSGTYTAKSTGVVILTNPLQTSTTVNGRLGMGALVGSSTEAGPEVFDLLIAIPASNLSLSNAVLTGPYQISSLELPGGGLANIRNASSQVTADGSGAFSEAAIIGHAHNLGDQIQTQSPGLITYSVSPEARGGISFPAGNPTERLIEGIKSIYVTADGTYFIGGSLAAGGHGILVGVKSFAGGATHDSWNGFFHAAGLSFDAANSSLAGTVGSLNVVTQGAVWGRRTRQTDKVQDASLLVTYSLGADGTGQLLSSPGQVSVANNNRAFSSTGVATDSPVYELSFGIRMPPVSGPGAFIDPQRVVNAANYAIGYPLSPGGFFSIFGTELASQAGAAPGMPFPAILHGVSVTLNGVAAPLFYVSPGLISGVVPFAAAGGTATVVVTSDGTVSNAVQVPLALTAPGIFTLLQNGLGDAATLHADYAAVNAANPARPGEIVQIFLAGLGPVSPTVQDGAPAPATGPLARVLSNLTVMIDGVPGTVQYQGLAPNYAGLYQLNIEIPAGLAAGSHRLTVETPESVTSMATIEVAP